MKIGIPLIKMDQGEIDDRNYRGTPLCYLSDEDESGRETQLPDSAFLALAHYLVSGLESLPGAPG